VISELSAENQKLKKQLEQQQQDSEKLISELRAEIADLQFKVDHAASESQVVVAEPEPEQTPAAPPAEPLFARAKPEVQVVTEKVVVKDPQDELRIKMLEEQLAQEKALYTKHIDELEEQLKRTRDQLSELRAEHERKVSELKAEHERQISQLREEY